MKKPLPYADKQSMTRSEFEADLNSRGLLDNIAKENIDEAIDTRSKITVIKARRILKTAEQRDLSRGSYRF